MDGGMGDIWSTGAFSFESPLKDLLDTENYTVEQLLEQDDLLQELRGMHPTLLEFFSQEEAVVKLIQHVMMQEEPALLAGETTEKNGAETTEPTNGEAMEEEEPQQEDDDWEVQKTPAPQFSDRDVRVLRYPYVACEVICSEINSIIDTLVDGQVSAISQVTSYSDDNVEVAMPAELPTMILDLFFSLLYKTEPGKMDDYRAGYFDKILNVLCRKRPVAMTTYMNEGGGLGRLVLMKAMLQHLHSQSILQVVQRLLLPHPSSFYHNEEDEETWTNGDDDDDEDDDNQRLFRSRWSESPEAVDMLLASLFKSDGDDADYELSLAESQNASEVIITMIQNSPLISPVLLRLTQDPVLSQIMTAASSGENFSPHDNRLTCSMNVLESLILQLGGYGSVSAEEDDGHLPTATAECLLQHLPTVLERLKGLLRHESTKEWVSMMQFSNDPQPILGTSRLRIIRLVECLVLLGNIEVDELLCQSEILQVCLDLFWEFEWNSMLHQSVANLLVHVFEGQNSRAILQKYFLQDCNLLQRLVESFEVEAGESPDSPEAPDTMSNDGGDAGENDVLPVSDDDIDVDLEREQEVAPKDGATKDKTIANDDDDDDAIERDPRDRTMSSGSQSSARSLDLSVLKDMLYVGADAPSHIPALRKGYMGHVIIVCQALVHACTATASGGSSTEWTGEFAENNNGEVSTKNNGEEQQRQPGGRDKVIADESGDSLIIADLIGSHPMQTKWQDFVTSTLASETAIQSTPLGGFQATGAIDPLHSHRPGPDMTDFQDDDYDDDDDDDDDIPGGDVIDMDDNDIEIAASMIDALSLPKSREFEPNEFGAASGGGGGNYVFDDPLGGGHRFDANFDDVMDNEDDDQETATRRVVADQDPPVMDLFAGNHAFENIKQDFPPTKNGENGGGPPEGWSDFASFDDAFSAPIRESFPVDSPDPAAEPEAEEEEDVFAIDYKKNMDDVFGAPAPRDFLLDAPEQEEEIQVTACLVTPEQDEEMPEEEEEIPMTSQYPSSRRRLDSDDDSSVDEDEPPPSIDGDDEAPPSEEIAAA